VEETPTVGLRTAPSRHDATAQQFLAVAAELIETYLQSEPIRPDQFHRLRHVSFPTALDWLRVEDVIRLAQSWTGERASRRAFFGRWPTRSEFLPDAVVYTLLREREPMIPAQTATVSQLVAAAADELLLDLSRHPRSYLILHLGPLLPRHPQLSEALRPTERQARKVWLGIYRRLSHRFDIVMRPEWTFHRMSSVLQAMLDGFLLRHRTHPEDPYSPWKGASILADAIIAFLLGAVDWDLTGQSGRTALDSLTRI
jgi:hypothetical protein